MYFDDEDFEEKYDKDDIYKDNSYCLQKCVQNHYSEPSLWDEMVKKYRRY